MMREAAAACAEAALRGAQVAEVAAERSERRVTIPRRAFLGGATAFGAAFPQLVRASNTSRVIIVGGGIAGLCCAHALSARGLTAQLYEWDTRLGGRIETLRGYFSGGKTAEMHAEFISSEHSATLALARGFGLKLENANATPRGTEDTGWFAGARYTQQQLNQDWSDFAWKLFRDAGQQVGVANHSKHSATALAWDRMSVAEWIEHYVPGGLSGRFGQLCYSDVIGEYGGPPEHQSALNLIYLLGYNDSSASGLQSPMQPQLAGSDEKWHIAGGNDQLITGLAAQLPDGSVHLGHKLVALGENADRSFTCTFESGATTLEATADHVVLAIPFTILRQIDLTKVTLSPLKQQAIRSLVLGNNAKIYLQVAGQPWAHDGYTGSLLTDAPLDGSWDGSSYQLPRRAGSPEILVVFPGGNEGRGLHAKYHMKVGHEQGPPPPALVSDTLAALEPVFPGVGEAWNAGPRLAWINNGNIDQHLLGAWSQYNVGQYTTFGGIEGKREGNLHFAGEHTSFNYQGFIEGAVRSGQRAAREI